MTVDEQTEHLIIDVPRPPIEPRTLAGPQTLSHPSPLRVTFVRSPSRAAERRRTLNRTVHTVVIVGLAISTLSFLLGVGLVLVTSEPMPSATLPVGEVFRGLARLRPASFLDLGLLLLLLTPVLRVLGTGAVFAHERDWRFAGVTTLVFLIMMISLVSGSR